MISRLFTSYKSDDEIYHDLMQFRVREILLVATIYDAFILEQEGKLTELIFGEYYQLNLSTAPRVTSVAFGEEAIEMLDKRRFDMVILTMRIDEMSPFELCSKIREKEADIPVLLLLSDDKDLALIENEGERLRLFDRIFTWNGDAKVLLAMIKYIEDKINVVNDTRIGLVRVILLVEDSIHYYSRYLPVLNTQIMKQTQKLIADENLDEMKKLLRMRTRPKVLIAETYEEAVEIFDRYRDYLLCVISDVKFPRKGKVDGRAGIRLVEKFKKEIDSLPVLLQSSNPENAVLAEGLKVSFLNKNSHTLPHDLTAFIYDHLGFGDFVFRDRSGEKIATAATMAEFRDLLHTVPDESLIYHSERNHFSSWLMARGEIQVSKFIQPLKISDFSSYEELRRHLIEVCDIVHRQKTRGKVIHFDESVISGKENLFQLSGGSVGGKGRGMVFLNMLIENRELFTIHPAVNVVIPRTAIIGTDEYDIFMEDNETIARLAGGEEPDDVVRTFLESGLSGELREKLALYLKHADYPLAVRSSSLFEDSKSQPFSGIYETYFLPNNAPDPDVRLRHLEEAIKLVYASVYSGDARSYLEAVNYKIGEEKMAVLLQGVAGTRHGGRFYPHISGLAQSYNYYPVSYLKPEDGIALLGLGMGRYVVEGERSWRFCPKYPKMDFISQEDMLKETQTRFYAVDLASAGFDLKAGSNATMATLDISEAEKDGTAEHLISVWDMNSGSMKSGTHQKGPRVMNFASILKYGYFPLSQILEAILEIITSSMGMPVQIEFAVDLDKGPDGRSTFYILQIKPLLGDMKDYRLDLKCVDREKMVLYSEHAMGNGVIQDLHHIIYADIEKFDRSRTLEMRSELERLNAKMRASGDKYILLGPGRWGTRDRFLGIPVRWSDISNARVIAEVELEDFHFDASLGSHFFHNITSKGVGYFSVPHASKDSFVDWEYLASLPVIERTEHFIHVRTDDPLSVMMDGRKSTATICKTGPPESWQ
jgi:CheY-like chemotaxis protein